MLGQGKVFATIAVTDLDRAKQFYSETLGLEQSDENAGGVTYACGGGTSIFVYPSPTAGTNQATYASWAVADFDATLDELRAKGVTFEHYDGMPGVTREGDVHVMGDFKSAWFKDPDGNVLAVDNQG